MTMKDSITPQEFVAKWKDVTLKERSAAQEHFIDLCHLVGHPTPAEADPEGTWFMFEAGADKDTGGHGWADVWKKNYFAFEYKGLQADLDKAYSQLQQYRESLQNPPLLIVSDLQRITIHTNFTNSVKRVIELSLDDLLTPQGFAYLKAAFFDPASLRADKTTEQVTQEAAKEFAKLAELLRVYGADPQQSAHFLIRILFCLFAEDIGLLPKDLIKKMVTQSRQRANMLTAQLRQLFKAMSTGGYFGAEEILHFNGGLFDNDFAIDLDSDSLDILARISAFDWSSIEPSIFGTLFERSLDPSKRSQLGAHYTSRDDILLIVEPVLMLPLRRRWADLKTEAEKLREGKDKKTRDANRKKLTKLLTGFADEIAAMRVLDPACGSGNFLYVSLRLLLDLQKEVITLARDADVGSFFPTVSPSQLFGIELNDYAHELAQTTIWIGYIQWLRDNGFGFPSEPILKPLHNIEHKDAILAYDEKGNAVEPEWHDADVIIGNPPFLGSKNLRSELGDHYVENLWMLYDKRVPAGADLVTFWFERSRAHLKSKKVKRAGLLATSVIRQKNNRWVLERIKQTGDIFMAWSDKPWILDGASLHISVVGFDDGGEQERMLDGIVVQDINPDLTTSTNLTSINQLDENNKIAFMGTIKVGAFDLAYEHAQRMINAPLNPNNHSNSDVVKPLLNGEDVTGRSRNMWIIDFGVDMPEAEASLYEMPFEYVKKNVKPERLQNNRESYRKLWWIHGEPRPAMREAFRGLSRYIATVLVAKHRLFVWVSPSVLPAARLIVFARDDDYFFGVLHSRLHEVWSLRMGARHGGERPTYNNTTCFETFPFPFVPKREPKNDSRMKVIAEAVKELVKQRDRWLNPEGATEAELKKRTLTNLYNERPTWLDLAHKELDEAVFAAYGWAGDMSDDEILARLLALNLERSKKK